MECFSLSVGSRDAWRSLTSSSPVSTWFQTPEAFDFYSSLPAIFEPFAYSVEEDGELKGAIAGYITKEKNPLKQFLTRRAIVIGGPLLAEGISEEALAELLNGVKDALRRKAIYIETRNFNDYSRWRPVFEACGWEYEPHYNFHVDTSSLDVVGAAMGKSRKRDVRTSLRDGAEVIESPTLGQAREFYSVLEHLYRTKVRTPLFPWAFFQCLYGHPSARFILVKYQGRIIGGTVCVCQEGRAVYEWFACGDDGVYKNIFPSTVATYSGIHFAVRNSYPRFDMMGAGSPEDGGYGVRDFKAKFGGALVEHGRFRRINSPLLYRIGSLGVKILKKI